MPHPTSISARHPLSEEERQAGTKLADEPHVERPTHRSECVNGPRPCPWVGCRYHLAANVSLSGALELHFGDDPDDWPESCALDVADRGGMTLDEIGRMSGVTRERIRQIEERALVTFRRRLREVGITDFAPMTHRSALAEAADEHGQKKLMIGPVALPADVPRMPRHPFVSSRSPSLTRRKDIPQKIKLDLLTGKGKRLVAEAVESGSTNGTLLHDRLCDAGCEAKIPSAKAIDGYLRRRLARVATAPTPSATALTRAEPAVPAVEEPKEDTSVGGTIELQASPSLTVPRGCAALLINVEDLRRLLG